MKIAFCFSGQFRNLQSTYEQYYRPNVFDVNSHHDIDVFVHSWFDDATIGTTYKASNRVRDTIPASSPVPEQIIEQLYNWYNPLTVRLERPIIFDEKDYNERKLIDAHPGNGLSRLYSIYQCNKLKREYEVEHNFRYDVVACARFDFMFLEPMSFDVVVDDSIYHPGFSPHGFNVCYAMGRSDVMDLYSSLYKWVDSIYRGGSIWADELLAMNFLRSERIETKNMNVKNGINRGEN